MVAMVELFNAVPAFHIHFVSPSLPQYIDKTRLETLSWGGSALGEQLETTESPP